MLIRSLVVSGFVTVVGLAAMAPTVASAAPYRDGMQSRAHPHKVCHWDRHHRHRVCRWVR